MTAQFADIARQAAAHGVISAEEILALRLAGWDDGAIGPDEADAIFALNDALAERSAEWTGFFVEAIGEFVINGTLPKGYVSEDNAAWLIARVNHDGRLDSMAELELLVRILERALNTSASLKAYVLVQVEQAVLTGTGPTRDAGELVRGSINASEAQILRRVLFAPGGDGPAAVSLAEAELLFRLKDATIGAANAPEWKRLFVQGVGNYLEGVASRAGQISRERAAELEAEMADTDSSVIGFLGRMAKSAPSAFRSAYGREASPEARNRLAELAAGKEITASEREWLDRHVAADGTVDEYEQALIAFLGEG